MNKANRRFQTMVNMSVRQQGMVTTFTGVMVLVLLTLMMFFAIRVGVFEQRVSANDSRQKLAFHTAESGVQYAKAFLRENSVLIASETEDLLSGGSDGWLSDAGSRWELCPADLDDSGNHPCHAEPDRSMRPNLYFYSVGGDTLPSPLPVQTDIIPAATEQVTVQALLCVLEMDSEEAVPVQGCAPIGAPVDPDHQADGSFFMVTILARGEADCSVVGGETECNATALVREQVSNFGAASGGRSPKVPLTTKSSFPPSGTAEVVPNPNAGGIGVPVSVWMNQNSSCSGDTFDPNSGSWATCEMHEWYGVNAKPDDMACSGTCSCTQAESISFVDANTDVLGIDLVADTNFPCDLFQFYFGVPSTSYEVVKGYSKIISDCDSLGEDSFGIYWVSGGDCLVNSNTTVGSPDHPVLLISAAGITRFNGGAKFYGVLFITDVEVPTAEFQSLGTNTVYGSVINDAILGAYQGTFQVVWADHVTDKAGNGGGLGSVLGGWSDFHRDWE